MKYPVLKSVSKSPDLNDSLNTVAAVHFQQYIFSDSLSSAELMFWYFCHLCAMLLGPDAFDGLRPFFSSFIFVGAEREEFD